MKKRTIILLTAVLGLGVYKFSGLFDNKGLIRSESFSFNYEENNKLNIKDSTALRKLIDNALLDAQGTYGIVIKNLKTNESFDLNENRLFNPGSLYKLWVMATVFSDIEKGILTEDKVLSQNIKELNAQFDILPEAAEATSGIITLTVSQALNQMITISHNYAALLLIEQIKRSNVLNFLKNHGLENSYVGEDPEATPSEIAMFLEKLYKGELANPENTAKMIDLLKNQQKNEKLPKYIPTGIPIAHKTGEIDLFTHDAGIVFSEKGDYIIVVMSESDSPYGAEERISNISKQVFDYFNL